MIRRILYILSVVLVAGCAEQQQIKTSGAVFGTTYHITYFAKKDYQKSIDSLFFLINKSLSTYSSTSSISKINRGDTTVIIDKFFREVFKKSKRIYTETSGYFDPTVGNLVNAWGFGPKKEKIDLSAEQVAAMMKFVGLDKVTLKQGKIVKKYPQIYLDFNAIAKGYGIDVVGRFLESKHIQNYLVEIGGEIRARGKKQNGKIWNISVESPNEDGTQSSYEVIRFTDKSMATSGNYRKYRLTKEGKKYVHTINPKTGYATQSNLLSASVIAPLDCADVDAYATAFMAMGLEKAKLFLERHPALQVILMYLDKQGKIVTYGSLKSLSLRTDR